MGFLLDAPHICPACGKLWYITGDSCYYEAESNSIVYPITEAVPVCPHCDVPLEAYVELELEQ